MRTTAGFVAGVVLALTGSAAATDHDGMRTTCHQWAKPDVYQCNVYLPDFDMARVKLYENGEYHLGVDYYPGTDALTRRR